MGAIIRILKAILLAFSFGFTKSSGPLQCYNDYDAELTCTLTLSDPKECSENKASLLIPKDRYFECRFNQTPTGACECRIQDVPGFTVMEIFTVNVSKGNKIWHMENISTEESIKPRRPIVTSVVPKPNGDFLITLNTTYVKEDTFSKSLVVELTYGIGGSNDSVTKLLAEGLTTYELVGRNLQPNAKYILRARMKSSYLPNNVFSDYSEPRAFKTPLSLQNILKIILPVLCLILIICIFSIYFWFNRILTPWWDKIPTPKFSSNFVKQVPQLLSFQNELSSVSPVSTEKLMAKKISVESSHVQGEDSHSSVSLGTGTDSAPLIYSSSSYEHVDDNSSDHWFEFDREPQSTTSTESYKNEQSYKLSSGMSNRTYSQSSSGSSFFFFKQPVGQIDQSENILVAAELLDPMMEIEFDYSMWNGCTESGNSKLIHVTPNTSETPVVLGYESLGEVCDHNALRSFNDPFSEKPFSIKKPEDVLFSVHDSIPIPMDEGYQCVA